MCGIVGFSGVTSGNHQSLLSAVEALDHRGPDASGTYRNENGTVSLGHVRLSILDLSSNGAQPMISTETGNVVIYNGELYNCEELKKKYLSHLQFNGTSDTEILLKLLDLRGLDIITELNGIFAFAFYDKKHSTIQLVRDRFGQKPLFYFKNDKKIHFCSEIKSLIATGFRFSSNQDSWYRYLTLGVSDDRESTFFNDVNQVEPGRYLEIDNNSNILIP